MRGIRYYTILLVKGQLQYFQWWPSMEVRRFTVTRTMTKHTATSSFWVIGRLLDAFSTVRQNGGSVAYRQWCCMAFVLLRFFDLCGNLRQNILFILFHTFEPIILLLEKVHQICQDFVCFRRWNNCKKRRRQRDVLRVQRRWRKECYVHCCGRMCVNRNVREIIVVISFCILQFEN